jgi:hypothetical protein
VADTGSPHVLIAKRELKVLKNKGKGTFKYKKGVDIKKKKDKRFYMSFYLLYFLILVIYFHFTTHYFKISNAVIATSILIPKSICCFPNFKKKKGKGKENGNLLFLLL